jgi:hypothetical protein
VDPEGAFIATFRRWQPQSRVPCDRREDVPLKPPAVLVNARAGRPRRDPELVSRLRSLVPDENFCVSHSVDEVGDILAGFRAVGADTLFVVGGDGSVTGALTPLIRVWPHALPNLVFTAGGTINTIARSLGAKGSPDDMLRRFLLAPDDVVESRRPSVQVRAADGTERHGMIFAAGSASRWLEHYYAGPTGPAGAASLVARILASALARGSLARRIFAPLHATVDLDGRIRETGYTVMGAGSVRDVGLVFAPFRTAGTRPDRIHWLETDAPPWRFGAEVPGYALGIYPPNSCLRHASAARVHIRFERPEIYTLDAELFPASDTLEIEAGPTLSFLKLRGSGRL